MLERPSRRVSVAVGTWTRKAISQTEFCAGSRKAIAQTSFCAGSRKTISQTKCCARTRKAISQTKFCAGSRKAISQTRFCAGARKAISQTKFCTGSRKAISISPQLGQTPRAAETLFFSHPLFCTRSMLTAHSADDIHALCQSHDYAVLLRSQPVGRVVEDYFLCKTRVSQCVCRISYTCLAVRADYFHDGISPERYSACLHWCRSALGGHIADMSSSEGGGLGVTGGGPDGGGGETFPHMIASCKSSKLSSRAYQASGAEHT